MSTEIVTGSSPEPSQKERQVRPQARRVSRDNSAHPKKLPRHMRREKIVFSRERLWYRRLLWRLKEDSQLLRSTVQTAFVLLCLWIGIEFYLFVHWGLSNGEASFSARPPGAEAFLPISALISLKFTLMTGIVNAVHPSGLFILIAVSALSIVLKKAFCSWICPIGTLSESLWMFGKRLFKRNLTLPSWLDYVLRSLKYILLAFFLRSIWAMDLHDLESFIYSPYNKVADIKMYLFFAEISGAALVTIGVLVALSVVIRNFWCRFLCPYGALLGIASALSPLKITRTAASCIDCELCTKACPAAVRVHRAKRVWSDECSSCMACVEACPVKDTLAMKLAPGGRAVPNWAIAGLVLGTFLAVTGMAVISGHWQNGISRAEYQRRFQQLNSPAYQHFQGHVPEYGPND